MISSDAGPTPSLYTQSLPKGGALFDETRVLLLAWNPGEGVASFSERVLREDLLGKATATRALDVARVFARRFLLPTDAPARHLRRVVAGVASRQIFTDLVFYYAARQDDLLRDFVVLHYWPAVCAGRLTINNQMVRQLLWEAEQDGRIRSPWSAEIKRDMAGRVLVVLTDFRLLRPVKPTVREILPFRPADGTMAYLAHLLHFGGVTDSALAEHPAWMLFGLARPDVWNRLDALAGDGWFILQRAGQVAQITWRYPTMDEVVDALAR